jgi:hypothetical protein
VQAEQTDVMALRLHNNAVALTKLHLAMLTAIRIEGLEPVPEPASSLAG